MHALGTEKARISEAGRGHDSRKGRQDRHRTELRGYRALRGRVSAGNKSKINPPILAATQPSASPPATPTPHGYTVPAAAPHSAGPPQSGPPKTPSKPPPLPPDYQTDDATHPSNRKYTQLVQPSCSICRPAAWGVLALSLGPVFDDDVFAECRSSGDLLLSLFPSISPRP